MSAHPAGNTPPPEPSRRVVFTALQTTVFRWSLVAAVVGVTAVGAAVFDYYHTPYWTRVGLAPSQPVLFSHRHHTAEVGIDCRFCHATVETSAFAGMPSTQTCLICHSQLFRDSPLLQPVQASAARQEPLRWNRVTRLPDHVYFNHSIHVARGVGCTTCHGDVGSSALLAKAHSLSMRWCLDCHRNPGERLGPPEAVFGASTPVPHHGPAAARALLASHHVQTAGLTDCSTCHR